MEGSFGDFIIGGIAIGASFLAASVGLGFLAAPLFAYGSGRVIGGVSKLRNNAEARIEGAKLNIRTTQGTIPVVYGKSRVGLRVSDMRIINAADAVTPNANPSLIFANADDDDILVKVGALALGSENGNGIQAVDDIRVYTDGVDVITSPAAFSSAPSVTGVISRYSGVLKYIFEDGDDAQTPRVELKDQLGWDFTGAGPFNGAGVAYGAFFSFFDTDIWTSGVPQYTVLVTGNRVYDPRTPTGGPASDGFINFAASGASADNPALCILDYLTSQRYGGGVPYAARDGGALDFVQEQSFIDSANYCDDLVSIPSGTEKRFRMNAVVDTGQVVGQNLAEMLATCRGELIWQNGVYRLVIRQVTTPEAFELTEDNIVGPIEWVRKGSSIPNLLEATFPDSLDGDYSANSVVWPLTGDTTFLDEDAGVENRAEVSLPYTTGYHQALRTIMIMLKEARNDVLVNLTAVQEAYTLEVGKVVKVTHEGPGWAQLEFTVRQVSLTPDGLVNLSLQQYTAAAYSLDSLVAQPSSPTTNLPDAGTIAVPTGVTAVSTAGTALKTQDGLTVPRIQLDWTAPIDPFLSHFDVRFRKTTDSDFEAAPDPKKTDTRLFIWPVEEDIGYTVDVRAVNSLGVVSAFVSSTVTVDTDHSRFAFDECTGIVDDDGSDLTFCTSFSFKGASVVVALHELDLSFFKDGVLFGTQDLGVAVNATQPHQTVLTGEGGLTGSPLLWVRLALKSKATNKVIGTTVDVVPVGAGNVLNEIRIPVAPDVTVGNYTPTPLHNELDSDDGGTTSADAAATGSTPVTETCEVSMQDPSSTPASSATQELRVQANAAEFGADIGLAGAFVDYDVQLIDGTTVIVTSALAEDIVTEPPGTDINFTLTDVQYDTITAGHLDLRIRIRATMATDNEVNTDVNIAVNYVRLEYATHT